jgi:hypothetical protein
MMFEYTSQTINVISACICNRCQHRLVPSDMEWHERLSISFCGGYSSIFGDGSTVSLDFCQQCVSEVLGQWLKIESPDLNSAKDKELLAIANARLQYGKPWIGGDVEDL